MKTKMRLALQIFLAILLLGQTSLHAQEQWFPRHLLNCKQRKTNPSESRETVAFLRPYPLETKPVNLEMNGRNLLQFLATEESLGRSVDKLMRLSSAPTLSSDDPKTKEESKNPFFFSSQAYSDCVLIVRGNSAIIFPRFMLLNPFFQQIVIREGYFVATVRSKRDPEGMRDLIGDFLFQGKELSRPAEISVTAAGAKQGAIELFMDNYKENKSGATLDVFFSPPSRAFELIAYESQPADLLDQRLLMLTRVRSGLMIHYLIPFRRSGALGSEGALTKKTVIDPTTDDAWRSQTEGLQRTWLQDDDKISVVTVVSATAELR